MYLSRAMDLGEVTSAAEIVGKTLYGITAVPVKRLASDAAPVAWTVPAGGQVGIVYSYLMPREGRTNLWWAFMDPTGHEYYAEHLTGRYDFQALRGQGVKTTEERIAEEAEANKPLEDKIIDAVKGLAIVGIAAFAAVQLIPRFFSSSTSRRL